MRKRAIWLLALAAVAIPAAVWVIIADHGQLFRR
jgi:hypothetical protein